MVGGRGIHCRADGVGVVWGSVEGARVSLWCRGRWRRVGRLHVADWLLPRIRWVSCHGIDARAHWGVVRLHVHFICGVHPGVERHGGTHKVNNAFMAVLVIVFRLCGS